MQRSTTERNTVSTSQSSHRTRTIILILVASVALMMTGYGIVLPVFAKRLGELGAGVEALGLMTTAFALGQFLLAPVMGRFADRIGRKPLILISLVAVVAANVAFLFFDHTFAYTVVRFLQGALSAGLLPASLAVVADLVPEQQRARWLGLVMGGYSTGFIFGPVVGGLLYDLWGFAAPFATSAVLAVLALAVSGFLLPETHRPTRLAEEKPTQAKTLRGLWSWFSPHLVLLLALDFILVFAFAFVEPQMVFHFYDALGFSTTQFGLIVGMYGLATVIGQTTLGHLSDTRDRRTLLALGFALHASFFVGIAFSSSYLLLVVLAGVAGLGASLITPTLSASYLAMTDAAHRSSVMGFKESAAALGAMAGPLLVALVSQVATPKVIFVTGIIFPVAAVFLVLFALRNVKHSAQADSSIAPGD